MTGQVLGVAVLHTLRPDDTNGAGRTAIDKRAVDGPVEVGATGLTGDRQCDTRNHGGPDKAVYAYDQAEIDHWQRELGRDLPVGFFGENLRLAGVDVDGALIGETWGVGESLVLEVTQPRNPCRTFADRMDLPRWVKRFTEHGAAGAYLRVVRPGPVRAGDPVEVLHRPGHGVSVRAVFGRVAPEDARSLLADDTVRLADSLRPYLTGPAARR